MGIRKALNYNDLASALHGLFKNSDILVTKPLSPTVFIRMVISLVDSPLQYPPRILN